MMANGSGFARGVQAGVQKRQLQEMQAEAASAKRQQAFSNALEETQSQLAKLAELGKEIASKGGDTSSIEAASKATAMSFGNFLEENRAVAAQFGFDPELIPDANTFVERETGIVTESIASGRADFDAGQGQNEKMAEFLTQALAENAQHKMAPFAAELARRGDITAAMTITKGILDPDLDIQVIQEGNENVTYLINTATGERIEEIARGTRTQFVREGPIIDEKTLNTEALESAQASAALRRNLTGTLPEVEEQKGSVGIRGQAGLRLGGLATVFLGEEAGDEIARAIAGNDQEAIAQVQTRLQTLRAQIIPIVTGEQSSRFSEPEREIANRALGVIDSIKGPADLTRAFPQVIGAMKELTVASLENEFEQASRSPAVELPYDLNTEEGLIALWTELHAAGFNLEEAKRARDRLIRIQNQ